MNVVLADHNIEGQADLIFAYLTSEGWLDVFPILLVKFSDLGLAVNSNDRTVWRVCQENQMVLLTDNRNMKDADSLGRVIEEENTKISLPVLTIGNKDKLDERQYREDCAMRMLDILLEIERYFGTGRLFIP